MSGNERAIKRSNSSHTPDDRGVPGPAQLGAAASVGPPHQISGCCCWRGDNKMSSVFGLAGATLVVFLLLLATLNISWAQSSQYRRPLAGYRRGLPMSSRAQRREQAQVAGPRPVVHAGAAARSPCPVGKSATTSSSKSSQFLADRLRLVQSNEPPSTCAAASSSLMSMRESYGFFCDDDVSWQMRKNIARQQAPYQERTQSTAMRAFYQENWEPDFSCSYESRIGDPGDGGKWLCDPHKLQSVQDCLIYSFGSSNKWDFEERVTAEIGPHCEIHTFDHTIGTNPSCKPANVQFHPWGIKPPSSGVFAVDRNGGGLKSLPDIVTALGHWGRQIHVLKIDVEGAEFNALPPLLDDGTFGKLNIQQVQLEVHVSSPSMVHRLLRSFRNAGYAIFHKEPNIQFPMSSMDVCVEYAFIRLDPKFWK